MDIEKLIQEQNNGAKFVKADLHVHSFGGSYDVTDKEMTPKNIINAAIENGLKILSITDHNNIVNIEEAIKYASDKDILLIPGVEITTTQGHLLIYSNNYHNLSSFIGKLDISEDKKQCNQGIVECLNIAKSNGCLGILAHIEDEAGFEKTIGRINPQMESIFKHDNLYGLEIKNKESINAFTSCDENPAKKALSAVRKSSNGHENEFELPKVMSSDAHSLDKLGVNAAGEKRLTRIKINELTFNAFKTALICSSSRIRIEDLVPTGIPHFVGMHLEGGLLDGQTIHFNKNLTCIIGGRGAGKSTMLESLRAVSGNSSSSSKLIDSDVWPDKISLVFEDETGRRTKLTKNKSSEVINMTNQASGIVKVLIDSYGQGETADTIQHSDTNPESLLGILDCFLDLEKHKQEDKEAREKLYENQSEVNKLKLDVNNIPEIQRLKHDTDSKIATLKKEKVGDIVQYQESLIRERQFRATLINDLNALVKKYNEIFNEKELFERVKNLDDSYVTVGKDQLAAVKKIVDEFSATVQEASSNLQNNLKDKIAELQTHLELWKTSENNIQAEIDKKRKELEDGGIPFNMGLINQVTKDAAFYDSRLRELEVKKKMLAQKNKEREELIKKRINFNDKIYFQRLSLSKKLNAKLKDTIADLSVTIKFKQGLFSLDFQEYIKTTMEYRTSQVPRAKLITDNISPFQFLQMLKDGNRNLLSGIKDNSGSHAFSDEEITRIFDKFSDSNILAYVETIEFDDKPEITVMKEVESKDGQKYVSKDFTMLSLGQQQSILLAIFLHSENNYPLIIDQPEDNLDSEFIYKTIVKNLQKIKETRQVIIVTHNPNIAVLGDAELIVPLKSTSLKSMIIDRGSIDASSTKKIACNVLEGGEKAFGKRKDIYGI